MNLVNMRIETFFFHLFQELKKSRSNQPAITYQSIALTAHETEKLPTEYGKKMYNNLYAISDASVHTHTQHHLHINIESMTV